MLDMLNKPIKVSHLWCEQMIDTLHMLNKDIDKEKIKDFVWDFYYNNYQPLSMDTRNIYKYEEGTEDPDNTLIYVFGEKQKLLGANGTLMDNHKENLSPTFKLIQRYKKDRKVHKDLMLKAKGNNDKAESDFHNTHSNGIKVTNNALYGAQAMEGSLFANIDSAQLITLQARNETTEMAWVVEKLLCSNMCFENFDEAILYIKNTIKIDDEVLEGINKFKDYLEYYPTDEDLEFRYQELIETSDNPRLMRSDLISKMIKTLSTEERVLFYYKNNLITFLDKNPKVMEYVYKTLEYQKDLNLDEIDKLDRSDPIFKELFLSTEKIPEPFKEWVDKFCEVLDVFVTNVIPTHKRVEKYGVKKRKAIVITDTDSKIFTVQSVINYFIDKYKEKELDIDTTSQYFNLKATMFVGTYVMRAVKKACYIFAKSLNVPDDLVNIVDFKNEFYFPRLAVYLEVKKNYVAYNLVQEGVLIPENSRISYTGIKAVSGELNPIVSKRIKEEITEPLIMKSKDINPMGVYRKIMEMQKDIKERILKGEKEYANKIIKFKGDSGYKVSIATQVKPRAAFIWNRLYPEYEIGIGDTVYFYNTIIKTKDDAIKYIKDKEILEKIMVEVYNTTNKYSEQDGSDFSRFGLSYICVPKEGLPEKLPEWLVKIIDLDRLMDDLFKEITELLPGLNFNLSKVDNTRKTLSSIIDF